MVGALTTRAAPHVLRLATLMALLDQSDVIRPVHLMAGIAVWDFCDRSVVHPFGDRTGNPLADENRDLLRTTPNGITRTELQAALGKHVYGGRRTQALQSLEISGLARRDIPIETGGRPSERWRPKPTWKLVPR